MLATAMTFNLRRNGAEDGPNAWPFRIQAAAKVIRSHKPLFIGTQEGYLAMLQDLERELPDYAWLGMGRFGGHEDEHNAIFYQPDLLSVVEQGGFWLSEQSSEPGSRSWGTSHSRICTWAHFRSKDLEAADFVVYNTHLDYRSQEAREKGIELIWDVIQQHRKRLKLPMVLLGDFNSESDNRVISFLRGQSGLTHAEGLHCDLKDTYSALAGEPGLTYHCFAGGAEGKPIDYVFVSPEVKVLETIVIRDRFEGLLPSDHYPVKTVLIF